MGSFILDFSAYNALLSSNGHGTSYYGADDAFLGGGDPGLSALPGRRNIHHHHLHQQQNQQHHQHQQQQQQQHQQQNHHQAGHNNNHPYHQISNRFIVYDRNSLSRLEAEKTFQDRRKQHIANFGATWLRPLGVPKTLFQIREECREQEEQAEAERREELAQQLAQAEAAALDGEGGTAGDMTGEGGGATGLMNDADGTAAAGVDTDMVEGEGVEEEQDLDNDIPDADGEDFSFGNNEDDDDPFASSTEEEEDEDEEEEEEEADDEGSAEHDQVQGLVGAGQVVVDEDESGHYTHGHLSGNQQQQQQGAYDSIRRRTSGEGRVSSGSPAIHPIATPVRSIDEQREQARARAAERREMRQMRATEDRMRAMRAHPRLSGMGMYGDEDDLDEEDHAQMLQEDDLVREPGPGSGQGHLRHRQHAGRSRSDRMNNAIRSSLGGGGGSNVLDDNLQPSEEEGFGGGLERGDEYDDGGLEMDMDADLDGEIPEGSSAVGAMDLSAFDGGYEHTDTEAELSSSVIGGDTRGGGDDDDLDLDLPHHSFLTAANATSGNMSNMGSLGGGNSFNMAAPRSSGRRFRSSLAQSDRNSLDISSLLSRDGSSNMGSSPEVRRL